MKQETEVKMFIGVGCFIAGAAIAMIIGFVWGGWSTSGTAKTMTEEAVLASQAAICVAQFIKQPDYEDKLWEFEKVTTYMRDDYIEKGGWDKMPGQEKADPAVTQACVDGIELLIKK
jgi:hypothetical protein